MIGLPILFVLFIFCMLAVLVYRFMIEPKKQYQALEGSGFKFDYVIKSRKMKVALDVNSQKIAVIGEGEVRQYPFSAIRSWQSVRVGSGISQYSELHITLADPRNPLVKLYLSGDAGDVWVARLSAILNPM